MPWSIKINIERMTVEKLRKYMNYTLYEWLRGCEKRNIGAPIQGRDDIEYKTFTVNEKKNIATVTFAADAVLTKRMFDFAEVGYVTCGKQLFALRVQTKEPYQNEVFVNDEFSTDDVEKVLYIVNGELDEDNMLIKQEIARLLEKTKQPDNVINSICDEVMCDSHEVKRLIEERGVSVAAGYIVCFIRRTAESLTGQIKTSIDIYDDMIDDIDTTYVRAFIEKHDG